MKKQSPNKHVPALLMGIVMDIINDMPLDVRVSVANLEEDEIRVLELTLGRYLQYRLHQLNDDRFKQLKDDCLSMTDGHAGEIDEAQTVLKTVWKVLSETHKLRVIK